MGWERDAVKNVTILGLLLDDGAKRWGPYRLRRGWIVVEQEYL
jgi:hypothetical protein